jgi:hypothetical protein
MCINFAKSTDIPSTWPDGGPMPMGAPFLKPPACVAVAPTRSGARLVKQAEEWRED